MLICHIFINNLINYKSTSCYPYSFYKFFITFLSVIVGVFNNKLILFLLLLLYSKLDSKLLSNILSIIILILYFYCALIVLKWCK